MIDCSVLKNKIAITVPDEVLVQLSTLIIVLKKRIATKRGRARQEKGLSFLESPFKINA